MSQRIELADLETLVARVNRYLSETTGRTFFIYRANGHNYMRSHTADGSDLAHLNGCTKKELYGRIQAFIIGIEATRLTVEKE